LEEESDGGLVAAEATGLEEAEEAGAAEVLDRFARDIAGRGGRRLAGAQGWDERGRGRGPPRRREKSRVPHARVADGGYTAF
jgi:hypothetical protein